MDNPPPSSNPIEFRKELQVSTNPVLIFLLLVAVAFIIWTGDMNQVFPGRHLLMLRIALELLILFSWLAKLQNETFGRYFLMVGVTLYLAAFSLETNTPELLFLLFIPIGLAGATVSPLLGLSLSAGFSAVMLLYNHFVPGFYTELQLGLSLVSIWGITGLMFVIYRPIYEVGDWVWRYYTRALKLVEETNRYRIELNQALEDLLHMNKQLALANEKQLSFRIMAEDAQKTKAAFVAKVSHEFRTPLNMIIGLVNLMIDTPQIYGRHLPKAMLDDLLIIQRNCDHLASMINDVLALSQSESGRLTLNREYVDLREIIEQALDVVSPLVKKKGLETNYTVPEPLSLVYCDRTRIRQVLLNLVSNAARFTESGGVYVNVEDQPNALLVSVRDTGPGISREDAEYIFDPFCQGATSRPWRDKGGTGLGLTISKQFIELHGGKIWLESQLGVGSTFYFNLPKEQVASPSVSPGRWLNERWSWISRLGKPAFAAESLQSLRLVVLDANRVLENLLSNYKDRLEYTMVDDVPALIQDLDHAPANLVLVNAPSLDALDQLVEVICKQVKDTPVVGCIIPDRVSPILKGGVVRSLVKPITRRDLSEAIAALSQPVRRVLIVDDDAEISSLYTRMLHSDDETREINVVPSGEAALRWMRKSPPDLVLLDISMPEMDGFALLDRKKADPTLRDVPVLIVSAMDLRENSLESRLFVASMANGLSAVKLLECAVGISEILFKPEMILDRASG
jgi:signal transduction histidine kinase/CheY-like chemotaxis protein